MDGHVLGEYVAAGYQKKYLHFASTFFGNIKYAKRSEERHVERRQSRSRNISFQILRSSSSVYANIREANYGQSPADMISKFEIALKEVYELEGWLDILRNKGYLSEDSFKTNRNLCGRIRLLLFASIHTLKAKEE